MMNEKEFYREMIQKMAIDDTVAKNAAVRSTPRGRFVVRKAVAIAAACAAVLVGTVFAIPESRAEVLRWFGAHTPEQYLTEDPKDHIPNEALDSLILETESVSPVKSQVAYVCDEPVWQQIANDFRIDLGNTMFDGKDLYVKVTLHGLTALPELDAYTGGSATQTAYPVDAIGEFFEDGKVDAFYVNGSMTFMLPSQGNYYLEFPDGNRICCDHIRNLSANSDLKDLLDKNVNQYGDDSPLSDADREAISRDSIEWLKGRTLVGVVRCRMSEGGAMMDRNGTFVSVTWSTYLKDQADENGIVTATLTYDAIEDGPDQKRTVLSAELGKVRFDVDAADHLQQKALKPETSSIAFHSKAVRLTHITRIKTDYSDSTVAATNLMVDLNGLSAEVENGGYLDALGLHDVQIRITLPDDWTAEACEAFRDSMYFCGEVEGELYHVSAGFEQIDGHMLRYTIQTADIPYDRIDSIETIRLIPALFCNTVMVVGEDTLIEMKDNEQYVSPDTEKNVYWTGETQWLIEDSITLSVQP